MAGPWITEREIRLVAEAAERAWYADANRYHARFESLFAAYVGRAFAIALPSCTSAIHLSLVALGVGPGDEVIVPDVTWIASAAPVTYVGATPVFADIDEATWCLDPAALARCISPRTRAVIVVDLYGSMPEYDAVLDVAGRAGIAVIEDAAEAVGSEYGGHRAGSFGESSTFSFHGSKTLTTGEGGMVVTDDEALHARMMELRDHGRPPGDRLFVNREVAFKYKMSALQAALGLAQLERVDELVARKRQIFEWYRARLEGIDELRLNPSIPGCSNSYWMVTVVLDPSLGWAKERLMDALLERGVDSRPFFSPLSSLPAYAGLDTARAAREGNVASYRISPWGVNLPSAMEIDEGQVDRVCSELRAVVGV